MPTIQQIIRMPAESFLNPDNFVSGNDYLAKESLALFQYEKGKNLGKEGWKRISISSIGVWGTWKEGSSLTSCEVIGYHACTSHLLKGMLESGVPIYVYRFNKKEQKTYVIKDGKIAPLEENNP